MNHISDDQLYLYALNLAALSAVDAEHLAACGFCRQELIKVRRFLQELAVAERSQISERSMERYHHSFIAARQGAQPAAATSWLRPTLQWDGRRQPAPAGVRSMLRQGYRLLYATEQAEVEVMVAPQGANFMIDGEILAHQVQHPFTPALVQLHVATQAPLFYETESTGAGRFRLESVAAGVYTLSITPPTGVLFEIEELEIS
jgi:hypothetical protein